MRQATFIERRVAFGWTFTRLALPAGGSYGYLLPADTPRASLPAVSFWTVGRVTGVNMTTGNAVADRVPGVLTSELPATVRAGRFVLTAQEYSEWWCVAASSNMGQLPGLTRLVAQAGVVTPITPGERIMICSGVCQIDDQVLRAGDSVLVEQAGELRAGTDILGLYFDRSLA